MTDPIVAFITAQLDRIEQATIRHRDGHDGPCVNCDDQDPGGYDQRDSCSRHIATAETTPYRDAGFGLRMVSALRQIVDRHRPIRPYPRNRWAACSHNFRDTFPCADLRDVAGMFEGDDGWDPAWKVKP